MASYERARRELNEHSNCESFDTLIDRKVDDELEPAEERRLAEHLASCTPCRERLDQLQELRTLIFEVGTTSRVEPVTAEAPKAGARSRISFLPSAAALLLIALALFLLLRSEEKPAVTPVALAPRPQPTLQVAAESSDVLAVQLPTKDPKIHAFWIYSTQANPLLDEPKGNER